MWQKIHVKSAGLPFILPITALPIFGPCWGPGSRLPSLSQLIRSPSSRGSNTEWRVALVGGESEKVKLFFFSSSPGPMWLCPQNENIYADVSQLHVSPQQLPQWKRSANPNANPSNKVQRPLCVRGDHTYNPLIPYQLRSCFPKDVCHVYTCMTRCDEMLTPSFKCVWGCPHLYL